MKVLHTYEHAPAFELSFDERAIVISALETFVERTQDVNAHRMLVTMREIDKAMRIMHEIATGERAQQ